MQLAIRNEGGEEREEVEVSEEEGVINSSAPTSSENETLMPSSSSSLSSSTHDTRVRLLPSLSSSAGVTPATGGWEEREVEEK